MGAANLDCKLYRRVLTLKQIHKFLYVIGG